MRRGPDGAPDDPVAWLVTVASRKLLDAHRSEAARRRREQRDVEEPSPGPASQADDTLLLLSLSCHPALTPASAVALTLRAVGGLTQEAIRLTRQLATATRDPEAAGLLALMLLHHARRHARRSPDGSLVPLAQQDRSRWDTAAIAEGVDVLQRALARDRLGEYQAQAAVAALHADAPSTGETDWPQVLEWYDELVRLVATTRWSR